MTHGLPGSTCLPQDDLLSYHNFFTTESVRFFDVLISSWRLLSHEGRIRRLRETPPPPIDVHPARLARARAMVLRWREMGVGIYRNAVIFFLRSLKRAFMSFAISSMVSRAPFTPSINPATCPQHISASSTSPRCWL